MQIFIVETLTGNMITLDTGLTDKISKIKGKIQDMEGIKKEYQCLLFHGKPLVKDDNTLSDYNIQNDSIIHLKTLPHPTSICKADLIKGSAL